ncbi:MAG: DUF4162 domain-containing protein, partial [Planctomycetota bacterium]
VRFSGDPAAGASLVRSDPLTRDVREEGRTLRVEYEGDDADVARLLRTLATSDAGLVSLADKEPTLEDVFMTVTKGLVT